MVKVKKLGVILEPTRVPFESKAVLNPACYQDGRFVHLFYRAIDGHNRSSIGYAKLDGPTNVIERSRRPVLRREHPYERKGVEDPRISKIGNTFYLLYVAHDGKNAVTAYATSSDLKHWRKQGVISPRITYHEAEKIFRQSRLKDAYFLYAAFYEQFAGKDVLVWEKDFLLFPEKFEGKFAIIHRILPDMQIVFFKRFSNLKSGRFWRSHLRNLSKHVVLESKHWFESRNIGGGAPPIATKDGWLIILHAVEETNRGRVYHATAALLDAKNPQKLVGRLHEPLFSPTKIWEKNGLVANVVFPSGTALFGDTLYIYYGAADKRIAAASVNVNELTREIKNPKRRHSYGKRR